MADYELLSTALDGMREGFALFDNNLRLLEANARFHELLQVPRELRHEGVALIDIGKARADRGDFGSGDCDALAKRWVDNAQDRAAQEVDLTCEALGTIVERFVPVPGKGVVITVWDNLRLHEAETKIARMSKFPDENPGPVLRFDKDNRLTYANPSSRDLLMRAGVSQTGDPAPSDWQETFAVVRERGTPEDVEYERAGATYSLLMCPVKDTDEVNMYGRDMTERKQHEVELHQAKVEADRANLTKSQFLANMSHELRTPMNAIIGFTRIVMRRTKDKIPEKQSANLDKVLVSAEHLLSLINNVLDLSKIEAGRLELSPTRFPLAPLVENCLKTCEPLLGDGVELVTDIESGIPELYADEGKIKQILLNLLSNAAKFTKDGSVTAHVKRQAGSGLTIAVRDTGIGIAEEKLGKVFEEFSQADASTTREYGGTGLGLTISKRLAQLMGGDIVLESTVGEGSTFTIVLPENVLLAEHKEETAPSTDAKPHRPAADGERVVLAIDDDAHAIELVRENLKEAGYRVIGVREPMEGLKLAREIQPTAITLDIMMGKVDGWQVLHELKSDERTRDIPVIMITVVDQKQLGFRLGASEYLQKPLDRGLLLRSLKRVTDGSARVLVVDDDPDVIEMVRQLLEEEGHTVISARNGEEGLERVKDANPDVVFLDLMMPVLDGFGVLDRLSEMPEHRNLPVVVLTAKLLSAAEEARLHERVQTVVKKQGLEHDKLIEELEAAVSSRAGGAA
jgi:signal transduction histidine kinase/CheY-like chemotaxis protein